MDRITSVKNPLVKDLRALKDRKVRSETGRFMVEGEKMILEALGCGLQIHDVLVEESLEAFGERLRALGARVNLAPRSILEAVCDTRTPQGVCASFDQPDDIPLADAPSRLVALDGVQDPGNVGTIWRTADAAGFQGILLGGGCADPLSPKVQRSAMGSGFRVGFINAPDLIEALTALQARGYAIVASDLSGQDFYRRPDAGQKFVLVIGNEARGISDGVREAADMLVKLPMRGGAESLNAAVAAGIMMYEMIRKMEEAR